jgi:hypothetical protein
LEEQDVSSLEAKVAETCVEPLAVASDTEQVDSVVTT